MKKSKGLATIAILAILAAIIAFGVLLYNSSVTVANAKHCTTQLVNATQDAQLCYGEIARRDQQCVFCKKYNNILRTFNTGTCKDFGPVTLSVCPLPPLPPS